MRTRKISVAGATPGQVLVPRAFTDPEYGPVLGLSADLLASALRRDHQVVGTGLRITLDDSADSSGVEDNGILVGVSYRRRTGRPVGIALVAHQDDHQARDVIEGAIRYWTGTLRSRRMLVADLATPCSGARRAGRLIEEAARGRNTFLLGTPGPESMAPSQNLRRTDTLDDVPDGSLVAFPAHGVPLALRAEAAARGLQVLDATCPLLAEAHRDVTEYADRNDTVIVIGKTSDAATGPLAAQATEATRIVETPDQADALEGIDGERLSFVIDPAMPAEEAIAVVAALRTRYPRLAGHHFDIMCNEASNQTHTARAVLAASDLTLILTSDRSKARTRQMLALAEALDTNALPISGIGDLHPHHLVPAVTIGLIITSAHSVHLYEQVTSALAGLGPLTMQELATTSDTDLEGPPGRRPRTPLAPPRRPGMRRSAVAQDVFRDGRGGTSGRG